MTLDRYSGPTLSLFRIVTGLFFFTHGLASLFGVFGGHRGTGQVVAFGAWPNWWAAIIELVCGGLVLTGLFTRLAATLASGTMAYAYFTVHAPQGLIPVQNGGELAAMFSWSFLIIAVLGPGTWALDTLIHRKYGHAADTPAATATENVGRAV
ncbi:DoxX family protein [Spongiactinospora sp. TRM90649]|uniref:DoxX family protein n=1 Tax=Spongiactinospora sp. TRM90649 TaxID=3031114 RepID=UPI0023F8A86B|nr:DoxX family protein [Spongiactinospora sp. TRM90649]MDF5753668.1 DoxX family protein [Spongiactinospora sp. TRM90649]